MTETPLSDLIYSALLKRAQAMEARIKALEALCSRAASGTEDITVGDLEAAGRGEEVPL